MVRGEARVDEELPPGGGTIDRTHTTSGVENIDEFAGTIVTRADGTHSYRCGDEPAGPAQLSLVQAQA